MEQFYMESIPKIFIIIPAAIVWVIPPVGSFHFDENTTIKFFGCPIHDEVMSLPCACLHGPAFINEEYCSNPLNSFILQQDCGKLINASYILQHHQAENELQISLNLNSSLDMIMTMVTGNCSFDCSGETSSPCKLFLTSFNYSTKNGPFYLKNVRPGNYCFRMRLLESELCVIHTRLYTFEDSKPIRKSFIHLGENPILFIAITIAAFTVSISLSIYIYKRGVKTITLLRMRNFVDMPIESSPR